MADRTQVIKPSVPRLASRRLLQKFGVHPGDRDAVRLDMRARGRSASRPTMVCSTSAFPLACSAPS